LLRDTVKQSGAAAVLATHSRAVAASADRVYRLERDGLHAASAADIE
jgi:putative ABC transport system ATP-binding protein